MLSTTCASLDQSLWRSFIAISDNQREGPGLVVFTSVPALLPVQLQLRDYFQVLFEAPDGLQVPSAAALTQCLKGMFLRAGHPRIYSIIDALNQCPNAYGMSFP
jgi:hypothetical protein